LPGRQPPSPDLFAGTGALEIEAISEGAQLRCLWWMNSAESRALQRRKM